MASDAVVEVRALDGPNRHARRPTVEVRVDVRGLRAVEAEVLQDAAQVIGAVGGGPDAPGSGARSVWIDGLLVAITRRLAAEAGVPDLDVSVVDGHDDSERMVLFGWRRLGPAELLGDWVGHVIDDIGVDDLATTIALGRTRLLAEPDGDAPEVVEPNVPTIAVTGTNGKTTTTRLLGHMGRQAGRRVAWNSTDGIFVDGELVDEGDWAGFGGAQHVLDVDGVELAVLEAARGGILRRGLGFAHADVTLVTNVSADHLGLSGVHTLEDLAAVKSTVVSVTRDAGVTVLNAEDALCLEMRWKTSAACWAFSLDPRHRMVAEILAAGGRVATVVGRAIVVMEPDGRTTPIIAVDDVPLTVRGTSEPMLANALAATLGGLAIGLPLDAVIAGLRTFGTRPEHNPGRMNVFVRDGVTVIADLAHNEDSLVALLEVGRLQVGAGGRLITSIGSLGDRTEELIRAMGVIAATHADEVHLCHKEKYLRDRDADELMQLLRAGVAAGGAAEAAIHDDEPTALDAIIARCRPGDAFAFATHTHYATMAQMLLDRGFQHR